MRLKGDSTDRLPSSPLAEANRGEEGDYRTRTYVDMVGGWNFGKSCEPLVSTGCWPAGKIPVDEVAARAVGIFTAVLIDITIASTIFYLYKL